MTCIHSLAAGLLLLAPLAAQAPDKARMKEDLYALASPGLEGRGTGERGQRLAADLVARRFREAGLQPLRPEGFGGPTPFHWPYALERRTLDEGGSTLTLDGAPLRMGRDAFASRAAAGEGPALFVGYGVGAADLGYDAYAGADLKGKWAVAFDGEPPRPAGVDAAAWSRAAHSDAKAAAARKAGALGLVLLQDGRPGGPGPRQARRHPQPLGPRGARHPEGRRARRRRHHPGFAAGPQGLPRGPAGAPGGAGPQRAPGRAASPGPAGLRAEGHRGGSAHRQPDRRAAGIGSLAQG
jgi:hypothetical protein